MKLLVIAIKGIKESLRDRKNFAFLMVFPILFLIMFRIAFGWGPEVTETYDLVVLDNDDGTGPWDTSDPEWLDFMNQVNGTNHTGPEFFRTEILQGYDTGGQFFVEEVLKEAKHEDADKKMFNIITVESRKKGEEMIKNEEAVCFVVIPANFSSALQGNVDQAVVEEVRAQGMVMNMTSDQYAFASVEMSGALGNFDYSFASSLVQGQLFGYVGGIYSIIRYTVGNGFPGGPVVLQGGSVSAEYVSVAGTSEFTVFDWQAPGIVVFALMMTAIYVALTLAMEIKNRTLQRLRLTKMSALDMMGGTTIRWLFVGVLQIIILIAILMMLGTRMAGDLGMTVVYLFMIAMVAVLASIALGLIVSSFVDDPEQAGNIGTAIVVPMSFLTGAFFPMDLAFAQVLPWTQAANALKQTMLYADWSQANVHMMYALAGAIALFIAGVIIFKKKRLETM
jgi:ABC-2 type transport system permease protein